MTWRNYCRECGKRIPRWERAFYGNRYHPVVCTECSTKRHVELYGSLTAYRAAMAEAIIHEESLG